MKIESDFRANIGLQCTKISGKPFKSGRITNTIKDVIIHPILKISAYTFFEDCSFVECRRVVIK